MFSPPKARSQLGNIRTAERISKKYSSMITDFFRFKEATLNTQNPQNGDQIPDMCGYHKLQGPDL